MDTTPTNEYLVHRPGAVSIFFVYKAFFFAACCWTWFIVLAARSSAATAWLVLAAASAVTFSLVGLELVIRHTGQHRAAAQHEQIMKTLVDLSWQTFAQEGPGRDAPTRDLSRRDARDAESLIEGDTSVIRMPQDGRRYRR